MRQPLRLPQLLPLSSHLDCASCSNMASNRLAFVSLYSNFTTSRSALELFSHVCLVRSQLSA